MPVVFPTVDSSSIHLSDSTGGFQWKMRWCIAVLITVASGFPVCFIYVDVDMSAMGFVMMAVECRVIHEELPVFGGFNKEVYYRTICQLSLKLLTLEATRGYGSTKSQPILAASMSWEMNQWSGIDGECRQSRWWVTSSCWCTSLSFSGACDPRPPPQRERERLTMIIVGCGGAP